MINTDEGMTESEANYFKRYEKLEEEMGKLKK